MELWIRSQDRECLMKVNDIVVEQNMVIGYFDKDTEYEYLGQYKSKERALEVLNEIQDILSAYDRYIKKPADMYKNIFEPSTIVYKMPKE